MTGRVRYRVRTIIVRCADGEIDDVPADLVAVVRCGNSACVQVGAVWFASLAAVLRSVMAGVPVASGCCDRPWMPGGLASISFVSLGAWVAAEAEGELPDEHFHVRSAVPVPFVIDEEAAA